MEFTCRCILTDYALDLSEFSFVSLMYIVVLVMSEVFPSFFSRAN